MLEGFDAGWIDAGTRREAFYTNLPPGRFRFRVAACNLDGECHDAARTVDFAVEPRYYQRAWFILVCIGGVVLAGVHGYQLRIRRLREHFALILAERSRIARELHDTLIQGFSGITMAMQALAARLPGADERRDARPDCRRRRQRRCARRGGRSPGCGAARRHIRARRGHRADVAPADRSEGHPSQVEAGPADRALPADVEYNLLRIAQEAVLNAVKHSGRARCSWRSTARRHTVQLLVKDDGRGLRSGGVGAARTFGVVGMQERAAHIGATQIWRPRRDAGTAVTGDASMPR